MVLSLRMDEVAGVYRVGSQGVQGQTRGYSGYPLRC